MPDVDLPHNGWEEREYQEPLWDYLAAGGKRAYAVWHRRAGKDDIALHYCAMEMHKRIGNVWYCLPEYNQGRKAIWTAVNPHTGLRRIDEAFPEILRENTNDNEMFIRFKNGSTFQVVGSDQHSRTVGASPMVIVFSEWSLANPSAWAYYRPILEENNGVAIFITTPRGRNHAHAMALYAEQSPDWFYQLLTVEDTGALTAEQLAETKKEYAAVFGTDMGNALYRQELYCDFNAAVLGAFYAHEMAAVRAEGRIADVTPLPDQSVHRAWDLGIGDDTSIWWFSVVGSQLFVYDHYAASGVGLEHYVSVIQERAAKHGWRHGSDYVPHDANVREWTSGRSRIETMRDLGLKPMPAPHLSLDDGINAVRRTLPLSVFHPRCEEGGVSALEQYRREWDDEKEGVPCQCRTRLDEPSCGCVSLSGAELARGRGAHHRAAQADRHHHSAPARGAPRHEVLMASGTVITKRFLMGYDGSFVNSDHIIRIYWSADKLMADMVSGADIQLKPNAHYTSPKPGTPYPNPMQAIDMVSL